MLGTDGLFQYLDKYDLELDPQFDGILGRHGKKAWSKFVTSENAHLVSPEAIDFLDRLLRCVPVQICTRAMPCTCGCLYAFADARYDHHERMTAAEAMAHAYLAPVRELKARQAAAERTGRAFVEEPGAARGGGGGGGAAGALVVSTAEEVAAVVAALDKGGVGGEDDSASDDA